MKIKCNFLILELLLLYTFVSAEKIDYEFSELYQRIGIERLDFIKRELIKLPSRTSVDILKMCIEIKKLKEENFFNAEESAYFIYEWLRKNIELNCEDDQKQEKSFQKVYTSGYGTSYGISNLFRTIGNLLELNIDLIFGKVRAHTMDGLNLINITDFVWNYIEINGTFYLMDASFSKGYCNNKKFYRSNSINYFGAKPDIFIYSHFPDDNKWQLLNKSVSYEEFETKAVITDYFYQIGFRTISPDRVTINGEDSVRITLEYNEAYMKYHIRALIMYEYSGRNSYFYSEFKNITSPGKIELYGISLSFSLNKKLFLVVNYYDQNNILHEGTLAGYVIKYKDRKYN